MEYYSLQSNEVVLYQGQAQYKKKPKAIHADIILTNLYLVFVCKTKKLFAKEQIEVETHSVDTIKIYNDEPQIRQKGMIVEIYLTSGEKILEFVSKGDGHKFVNAAWELLTSKTAFKRGADKIKGTVEVVDDTLGISTMGTIKNMLNNGVMGTLAGVFEKKNKEGMVQKIVKITKGTICDNENKQSKPLSLDEQVNALEKLKILLDENIRKRNSILKRKR